MRLDRCRQLCSLVYVASRACSSPLFFFFTDTATTEIYTLSLHDALPISGALLEHAADDQGHLAHEPRLLGAGRERGERRRSEEHTSELQSHSDLVCRLLLEKKNEHADTVAHLRQSTRLLRAAVIA